MSHANAALTPRARLRLARLIVEDGWQPSAAAKMFMVSTVTARKWAARLRADGPAGMQDRSSRPKSCPHRTSELVVRDIVRLRWRHRLGPVQIAGRLDMAPSTVHAVLVRARINRLSHIDRVTAARSAATAAAHFLFGLRFVDRELATIQIGAVHLLHRELALGVGAEGHERKAAGTPGHAVAGEVDVGHAAEVAKGVAEIGFSGFER